MQEGGKPTRGDKVSFQVLRFCGESLNAMAKCREMNQGDDSRCEAPAAQVSECLASIMCPGRFLEFAQACGGAKGQEGLDDPACTAAATALQSCVEAKSALMSETIRGMN